MEDNKLGVGVGGVEGIFANDGEAIDHVRRMAATVKLRDDVSVGTRRDFAALWRVADVATSYLRRMERERTS